MPCIDPEGGLSLTPFETYLKKMREKQSSGEAVPETTFYGTLEHFLDEIGATLKPKVKCVINIRNRGAGIPDGGLFTSDQLNRDVTDRLKAGWGGQIPARGVLEVKSLTEDVSKTVDSKQVMGYLGKYGQILVTNYREFVLVGRDSSGKPIKLERYSIADSESEFWETTKHPKKTKEKHEKRFVEYLLRVMLSAAELRLPENLAWLLASYARDARERIENADLSDLNDLRDKLQAVLGITFGGKDGEHFFRSTLIQTIFYGIFAAWVLWSRETPIETTAPFDWRIAGFQLRVPVLKKLFEQVATSSTLEDLDLIEVLHWTGTALNRVNRKEFFEHFEEEYAVQYFYEPFLEAFDPQLRKNLGVWYTPREIVKYMVERVDTVLREELDEPDGLASNNVYVLDPSCGTGAYLVEVLQRIERTIRDKGEEALSGEEIKTAAMKRILGFEILPASFVISHLEVSLFSQSTDGVRFTKDERPGIYLTNALTGWEHVELPKQLTTEKGFKMEWEAANRVKRDTPILVILGNPPYNAFAGVSPEEEAGLVQPYKEGLIDKWGIKRFNLDDYYVRFFRLAERRIAEMTGRGIVCYISNFSYLGDPSFVVMRQSLLNSFDKFWFDCMNGDSRETGKVTPDGKPDPSVFSTKYNRAGIRVGTAIGLMVRTKRRRKQKRVLFRHFWGVSKKTDLLESLKVPNLDSRYEEVEPLEKNRFSFLSSNVAAHYYTWPKLSEFSAVPPFHGPVEMRGSSLIAIRSDKAQLRALEEYLNSQKTDEEIASLEPRFMRSSGEFDAVKARAMLKGKIAYDEAKLSLYPFKPLDLRVAYLDGSIQPLFSRPSPELLALRAIHENAFFITRDTADKDEEGAPFYFSNMVCDYDFISGHARHFPILVPSFVGRQGKKSGTQELLENVPKANLSQLAREYLAGVEISCLDTDRKNAAILWMHALAIGYSPFYLLENRDGVRQDWPRVPLPNAKELLTHSAHLGERVACLLDTREDGQGITSGTLRRELRMIGVPSHVEGKKLDVSKGDFDVTAGWGHPDNRRATMPGKGKALEREYEPIELAGIEAGAADLRVPFEEALALLGETTFDIHLNSNVYWKNVPSRVWGYTIGGYQVIKKWLSYREQKVLGRSLNIQEVREVPNIARRIAAIILLQPELNANYKKIKESAYLWKSGKS
jgi:hypothetical protein